MGELLNLAIYNPAQLDDEDFLKCFVARHELANKILARLREIKPRGVARHGLIIGQRGMGKTSMLRRIALGIRETPELAAVLLPLSLREEQYNIHNMHVFWCNCLDALGDYYDATGQHEKALKLDREVLNLNSRDDDDEGSNALGLFRGWMKLEGKRALLLLDNIDLIFDGLKDKQWSLRRILQEAGGIIVIGASAGFLEATSRPDAAFYDFFKVDVLEKLSPEELSSCLRQLAVERGEPGQKVTRILDRDPARIQALYDLTGGNPRTLSMLYLMLEVSEDGDIMADLEKLLDQSTPLYKAKVEELAIQARVVFDAVALAWNPVTAAEVAANTGLEVGAVSTQLDRLFKNGVLEKTSLSSTTRTGFMVAERFFNIWYLMRHAPRRQRNRLRWLAEFLRKFHTKAQLADHAVRFIQREIADELTHTPTNSTEWLEYGHVLQKTIRDYEEAEAAYRKAIELDPKDPWGWNRLGYLLFYFMNRPEEGRAAYEKASVLAPNDLVAKTNLLVLDLITGNKIPEEQFEGNIALHPGYGASLLRSIKALMQDNFGEAVIQFHAALTENFSEALESYRGIIVLVLRQFAMRGYGKKLLTWMNETQIADLYWPLYAAFDAYLYGDERLRDVNPEVRRAANPILVWLKGA